MKLMEEQLRLPLIIVEANTGLLVKANKAAHDAFQDCFAGSFDPHSPILPFHDRMSAFLEKAKENPPYYYKANLFEVGLSAYDALATGLEGDEGQVCVILCKRDKHISNRDMESGLYGELNSEASENQSQTIEALNRQLHHERLIRQIMSKVYSSLDKDAILQALVDNLGRALKCQRCLVVIESPSALPIVTHEYAEADISPLGLGRTAKFPLSVFERFRDGVMAVPDMNDMHNLKGVILGDVNDLLDNNVCSMLGAPMVHRGVVYGVIAAMQLGSLRKWDSQDLSLLQICAHHAAISLEHCQSQQRIKDQLFNVNVWSNLTQQLTATLESASRSIKPLNEKAVRQSDAIDVSPLSSRELEVLRLIASGLANKEIANQLFLTESTVELHASRIRKKLKLRSRTALVKYACDHNIV